MKWNKLSTSFGLMYGHVTALDGWLAQTDKPFGIPNASDYFSRHYQCFGYNCQAMCGPNLAFYYFAVCVPGKTNDICAFDWCSDLIVWLNNLPDDY